MMAKDTRAHTVRDKNPQAYPNLPQIDFEAYLPYLEDDDIPEDQKRALIEILFHILMGFADIAFDLSPVKNSPIKNSSGGGDPPLPAYEWMQPDMKKPQKQFNKTEKGGDHESI